MPSQGPLSPALIVSDPLAGVVAWDFPENAGVSDDAYASFTAANDTSPSQWLSATNFGFTIPSGATIDSITVEIERSETSVTADIIDVEVKLLKAGVAGENNQADIVNEWPLTDAYKTYAGGLWGDTWTANDINATNFGVVLSAQSWALLGGSGFVDHIRITVAYTGAAPIPQQMIARVPMKVSR